MKLPDELTRPRKVKWGPIVAYTILLIIYWPLAILAWVLVTIFQIGTR